MANYLIPRYKLKNAIITILIVITMLLGGVAPVTIFAVGTTSEDTLYGEAKTKEELVDLLFGYDVNATNITGQGTSYFLSGAEDVLGIDEGIVLDTSGEVAATSLDSDLSSLNNYTSSGNADTSVLEFTVTASGSLLNFSYVFASSEFGEDPEYNDIFGLFVSVNGGDFENIATLDNKMTVSIENLTSYGYNEISALIEYANYTSDHDINGCSYVLSATKEVEIGDEVTIKLAIQDVTDEYYDSYVIIQAGTISFDPPNSSIDYSTEELYDLDENSQYIVSVEGGETYEITSDSEGRIPLVTDEYNFIGETLSILKSGVSSEPLVLTISDRVDKPEEDIQSDNSINVTTDMEYSIDQGETWLSVENDMELAVGENEILWIRYKATESSPTSDYTVFIGEIVNADENTDASIGVSTDVAETGDDSNMFVYIAMMIISLVGLSIFRKRITSND